MSGSKGCSHLARVDSGLIARHNSGREAVPAAVAPIMSLAGMVSGQTPFR